MPTIKQVAKHAGVSPTTVSHTLNYADRVSDAARRRVMKSIKELDYRPNLLARSLRTGRTNLIALLIPDICNPFYPELVQTIQSELGKRGLDTLIYNTDVPGGMATKHAREYLPDINRQRVDGAIIVDVALLDLQYRLRDLDIPAVFIGQSEQLIVDSVRVDEYRAVYRMAEYLIEKGHRRIGHIMGAQQFLMARQRRRGFEQALRDHGMRVEKKLTFHGTFLSPSGREGIGWLLDHNQTHLPTAVFIANSLMTFGALAELYDRSLRVPDDLAIATFDEIKQMDDVRPRLTTINKNPRSLGSISVRMLMERLDGKAPANPRIENLPFSLIQRQSA